MSYLRFNHVFFGLMLLSLLSALFVPARISDRVPASVANLFLPVAYPVRRVSALIYGKVAKQQVHDEASPDHPRLPAEVYAENERLRALAASLKGQVLYLQERQNERQKLGEIGPFCTIFPVVAGDSAGRDSLMLGGTTFDGIKEGMAVLYSGGFAGRIFRAGIGEARVRLVTDKGFKIQADFARQVEVDGKPDLLSLNTSGTVLEGQGKGTLISTVNSKFIQDVKLQQGDWATVKDGEWPKIVWGYRIGQVKNIAATKDSGWFAVTIEPFEDLLKLREVLVVNKLNG